MSFFDTDQHAKTCPRTAPKPTATQMQRRAKIYEVKTLRSWENLETRARAHWKQLPQEAEITTQLFIHEVFALAAWRARDGGASITVPVLEGEASSVKFRPFYERARAFLEEGDVAIAAAGHGSFEVEMRRCLAWNLEWLEYVRVKLDGPAVGDAVSADEGIRPAGAGGEMQKPKSRKKKSRAGAGLKGLGGLGGFGGSGFDEDAGFPGDLEGDEMDELKGLAGLGGV